MQAADRAGADDDDVVALADPGQFLPVEDAGERLGDRSLGEAQVVGDPVEPVDVEHRLRHDHVLGEAAGVLVAHRRLVGAHGHPAAHALVAHAAGDGGDHLDAVADLPALDAVADLDDLAGDLMAHHLRRVHVLVAVLEDLDVGAAGRAVA